jgi:hypothetical protein
MIREIETKEDRRSRDKIHEIRCTGDRRIARIKDDTFEESTRRKIGTGVADDHRDEIG